MFFRSLALSGKTQIELARCLSPRQMSVSSKMKRGRRPLRAHEVNQTALFQRVPARGRDFPLFAEFRTFLTPCVKSVAVLNEDDREPFEAQRGARYSRNRC